MMSGLQSVDLHSHTVYSDGVQSPAELVRLAKANGVRTLSITDHDHTGGIDEALVVGAKEGVEIIPGIELSVSYAEFDDIHLLAYYVAWRTSTLQAKLSAFQVAREHRAERILASINTKLQAEGRAPLRYEAVKVRVRGAFGRPHIANMLIEQGYVPDINAAFHEYLIPCNVPKLFLSAEEALTLIHEVRGMAVVAHPKLITADHRRLREILTEFRAYGLDGIEAYHNNHDADDRLYLTRVAEELGIMITGGSDYHGFKAKPANHDGSTTLGGQHVPYGIATRLRLEYLTRYPLIVLLLDWPVTAGTRMRRAIAAHYKLAASMGPQTTPLVKDWTGLLARRQSLVLDLPSANMAQLGEIVAQGETLGVRIVGVPWLASTLAAHAGLYHVNVISPQRWQRTPIESLAHELVHEVILAQLHW